MRNTRAWSRRAGALAVLAVALLSVTPVVDRQAENTHRALFQRALVTFALARTLNGVISAVQGTELALQPAGVGLTLTPGEILDPVNDLVERFSWIMLGATVSLGLQQVLMEMGAWWPLKLLAAVVAVALAVALMMPGPANRKLAHGLFRVLLVVLFLRFAIPLTLMANEVVYGLFLESNYTESTAVISDAGAELEALGGSDHDASREAADSVAGSLFGGVQRAMEGAADSLKLRARVENIGQRASAVIEHIINLSVVFILQTAVLPIAFLWVFLRLLGWLFGRRPPLTLRRADERTEEYAD